MYSRGGSPDSIATFEREHETMKQRLEEPSRATSLFVCILGLGFATWTGCEKSESGGDEPAEAQKPSGSEQAKDEPDPSGSPAENPPPKPGTKPGGNEPGSPSPSAGSPDEPPAPGGAKPGGGGEISDAELKKFVDVTEKLRPKKEKLKKALDEAETPSEAKKAQKKVMQETRKAAEEVGLSFDRFRAISRRAKTDPSVQKKLREITAERAAKEK